jgi:hypothetical protein
MDALISWVMEEAKFKLERGFMILFDHRIRKRLPRNTMG